MDARSKSIIVNVEQIVRAKLCALPLGYRYHGFEHTEQVVRNALAIAEAERLPEAERPLLLIAAWLHDFMIDECYVGHEAAAGVFTESFLAGAVASGTFTTSGIERIKRSIMATKLPQKASNQLSKILADADLLYLGTELFFPWSARLREEHLQVLGRSYTDLEWIEININFLREHRYFTSFARSYCGRGIRINLSLLNRMRDSE